MVKEYGHLLRNDSTYAEKAALVSEKTKDLAEVFEQEDLTPLKPYPSSLRAKVALHTPCTLQHGQQKPNAIRSILQTLGFTLVQTTEDHICCGSAGTYSVLQPDLSDRLLKRKVTHLTGDEPTIIVTANVGCQLQLTSGTDLPVHHWIELLDGIDAYVG